MTIIKVENLGKVYPVAEKKPGLKGTVAHFFKRKYRMIDAVKQVSFSVEPGEIVGFLGPNGAGKTTTLKMLTGLIHPTHGQVSIANHTPFHRKSEFLQTITLVMGQKQQLIWDLPALDSLKINAAVYGISDRDFRHRVGELSAMLEMDDKLTQPVRKLSLGERMKAELLAALIHQPQVLFLDEPTLGLDVNAQVSVRAFLKAYNEQHKATILLTSHYMADITALCDRVLLIYKGQLIYDGALDMLLNQFAPYREVTIEMAEEHSAEDLEQYANLKTLDGRIARFIVNQEDLTEAIATLLKNLNIIDLTVTDSPVEEVIGRVFQAGSL